MLRKTSEGAPSQDLESLGQLPDHVPIIYGRGRGCTQDKTESATRTPALPDELSFRAATSRQRDPYWRAGWRLIQSSTPGSTPSRKSASARIASRARSAT